MLGSVHDRTSAAALVWARIGGLKIEIELTVTTSGPGMKQKLGNHKNVVF
jgi:hypothetical protein